MGVTASLSSSALRVEPGGTVAFDVRVRNTGTVVDQFSVEILGDAAPWAVADPPTVSLFPGAEDGTHVRFTVPRSAGARTGAIPFGVQVRSREDPEGSVVEEGTLEVGGFIDVSAELLPRTSHGGRMGRHAGSRQPGQHPRHAVLTLPPATLDRGLTLAGRLGLPVGLDGGIEATRKHVYATGGPARQMPRRRDLTTSRAYAVPYDSVGRKQVLVQLDEALVDQLDRLAARQETNRSELLRRGAAAVLAAAETEAADQELRAAYRRVPQDPALVRAAALLAAHTVPEW